MCLCERAKGARRREEERQIVRRGREERGGGEEDTERKREKGRGDQGTRERGGGRKGQEGMHGNEAQAGRPRFARPAFHQRQGELSGSFSSVSSKGAGGDKGRERATGHGLTP